MYSLLHVLTFLISMNTISFPYLPSALCPHVCQSSHFPYCDYNDCLTFVLNTPTLSPISLHLHCVLIICSSYIAKLSITAPMFITVLNHPKLFVHVSLFSLNIPETIFHKLLRSLFFFFFFFLDLRCKKKGEKYRNYVFPDF